MTNAELFTFRSADGVTELRGRRWMPDGEPRAVVQLVHGLCEHVGRYERFARVLTQAGFAVAGHDHLGHGSSLPRGGAPIWFAARDGWRIATDDVYTLHRKLRQDYPGLPCFILGHSMGSFLIRSLLIRYPGAVDGAILIGTGWNSEAVITGGRAVANLLCLLRGGRAASPLITALSFGSYNKPFAPSRTDYDWLTSDAQAVDRYIADPQCGQPLTAGLFRDMLEGFRFNQKAENLAKMDTATPVLLLAGQEDPVGAMGAGVEKTADAFRAAGVADLQLTLYPGLRHEILNEAAAPQTADRDILRWLEAHM